ncbi:hypothetical protein [Nonomuraea typhae]|uniref:hypothetical protein n=1 Tax=Nonomuraea typhae TaxID=2603600 RepID=UPI001CA5C00A|nr:hypothetical protein [Nonomuraea typhae]
MCRQLLRHLVKLTLGGVAANVVVLIVMGSPPLALASPAGFGACYLMARQTESFYAEDRPLTLSRAGRGLLDRLRLTHPHGEIGADVAMSIALYGLSHLGDPALVRELTRRSRPDGHLYPANTGGSAGGCGGGGGGGSSHGGSSHGGGGDGGSGGGSGGGGGCGGGGCGGGG